MSELNMFDQMFTIASSFLKQYGMDMRLVKVKLTPDEDTKKQLKDGEDAILFTYALIGPAEFIERVRNYYKTQAGKNA